MHNDYADKKKELKYKTSIVYRDNNGTLIEHNAKGLSNLDVVATHIKEHLSSLNHDVNANIEINKYKE